MYGCDDDSSFSTSIASLVLDDDLFANAILELCGTGALLAYLQIYEEEDRYTYKLILYYAGD